MTAVVSVACTPFPSSLGSKPIALSLNPSLQLEFPQNIKLYHHPIFSSRRRFSVVNKIESDPEEDEEDETHSVGVKAALSMLQFYKREISPLLPKSCRYVPSCSEYSMIAYKKYGVAKGTVLTAWRLCRCNPLGGSGFDPPRWFGEEKASEE